MIMAVGLLVVFRIGLLLLPFSWMFEFMHRMGKRSRTFPQRSMQQDRIVWIIKTISRYLVRPTCLPQAMTAQTLLTRYGHDTELRIGIKKNTTESITAHAWVADREKILIGDTPDISKYTPFRTLKTSSG
jgi:hypothetical protein